MKDGCFNFIFWAGIIFFCSLVLCNKTLPMESRPMKVLSVQDKAQIFEIPLDVSFLLILPNPGSGGYVFVDTPEFDPQILILQNLEKKPPSDPDGQGNFGVFEWTFRAKKEGISAIVIRAFRPWEKDNAPMVIFKTSVHVNQ
ncbi:MAG: protease inhibitor I42 family protein [Desulfobacteraceae bacterium]|nr:protease inhibitor I42 family protein [Desulfobacteraceae bacterium]MBC2720737.1 protease inhibitor I42 family protein [Desulfobacteraceae bacterium]